MNIRIMHPRRSGGHAVIFWLMRSSGSYAFYNSLPLISKTPKAPRETSAAWPENTFWSHEDPNRSSPLNACLKQHFVSWMPKPDKTILIVRDYYNYAASKIKASMKHNGQSSHSWRHETDAKVWKEFAVACLENKADHILYNRWLFEETYRAEVAERYGWKSVAYNEEVPEYGGGSSFSGHRDIEDKQELIERWKILEKQVRDVCDSEIHCLNEKLFGWKI